MIGYVTIGHNGIDPATAFYDKVLAPLGYARSFSSGAWAGYGPGGKREGFEIYLAAPHDGKAATFGNGSMLAFRAEDRAAVEACHKAALEAGGTDEGAPGIRGEFNPPFYGAYFRDPTGNKICVFVRG